MAPKHMISERTPPFLTSISSTCQTSLNLTLLYCLAREVGGRAYVRSKMTWSTPPCYMTNTLALIPQHQIIDISTLGMTPPH